MNVFLIIAGILTIFLGLAHSILGEKLLLGPLFQQSELPKLRGSTSFAQKTLRFAWHITTLLLVGIGVAVIASSQAKLQPQTLWNLRVFSIMFALCGFISLIASRAKHFSWFVFLIIAVTIWLGTT